MYTDEQINILTEKNGKLFSYIMGLTKDRFLTDDICQDTCLRILVAFENGKYKEEGYFLAYARNIAHNVFLDHVRNRYRKPTNYYGDMRQYETADTGYKKITGEEIKLIVEAIDSIASPEIRDVLILRTFYDMKYKRISQIMKCSQNTALGRMRYALKKIRSN